jgi:hypothetical protein
VFIRSTSPRHRPGSARPLALFELPRFDAHVYDVPADGVDWRAHNGRAAAVVGVSVEEVSQDIRVNLLNAVWVLYTCTCSPTLPQTLQTGFSMSNQIGRRNNSNTSIQSTNDDDVSELMNVMFCRQWAADQRDDESLVDYFRAAVGQHVRSNVARRMPCIDDFGRVYVREINDRARTKLVVPRSRVAELLASVHGDDHLGKNACSMICLQRVFWARDLRLEVSNFVDACGPCRTGAAKALRETKADARFASVDLLWVPMPRAPTGDIGGFLFREPVTDWIRFIPEYGCNDPAVTEFSFARSGFLFLTNFTTCL